MHLYLLDEAAGTDARGPNESLPASHEFGPWACEDQAWVQTNVCYVWLLPVHRYLLAEAAGTDARGSDASRPASHAIGPWTFDDQAWTQTYGLLSVTLTCAPVSA